MKQRNCAILFACLLVAVAVLFNGRGPAPKVAASTLKAGGGTSPRVIHDYGNLPLRFEANQGQTDSQVKFLSRGIGYTFFLTSAESVLVLSKSTPAEGKRQLNWRQPDIFGPAVKPDSSAPAVVRMTLAGANPHAGIEGLGELPGASNYLIGNDPAKWRTNVSSYAKVKYRDVYPGVDLIYYGNQRQLEFDLVVAPGADPGAIKLDLQGADKVELDAQGDLVLEIKTGAEQAIRLRKPSVYQEADGVRREVPGSFVLQGTHQVGFNVAAHDVTRPLVIDPVLVYSTYLGGSSNDAGYAIAVDSSGNAYVTGTTRSTNFPTATPVQRASGGSIDTFVAKLNSTGSALVYSTYLGGSGDDTPWGIAVDSSGTAYVTGETTSNDFPTANALQAANAGMHDGFVVRLNSTGSALVYSTYLGGGDTDGGYGIAVDPSGNAYVTGATLSTNFPTTAGALQRIQGGFLNAFVAKLNPTGTTLVYSTYLGGNGVDAANGIAVDTSGSAYVTGVTILSNFPTLNPFQRASGGGTCVIAGFTVVCPDAFVTKLNPTGSGFIYSTYLGGSGDDEVQTIAVDSSGSAYVTGYTLSRDFPTANPFQAANGGGQDVFVTKLNSTGSALVYSTYLGGGGTDRGFGIAVDSSGNAYVTGVTGSSAFPILNPLQSTGGFFLGTFVAKLTSAGSALIYSTPLADLSAADFFGVGHAIAVDSSGNAYVTGVTSSDKFPTVNAVQSVFGGGPGDAFVVKISDLNPMPAPNPVPVLSSLSPSSTAASGAAFSLGVTGSNFITSSVVRWNGSDRMTTYVSSSRLTASIPASDIATAGTAQVTVFNAAPAGGSSNALPFTIASGPTSNCPLSTPSIMSVNSLSDYGGFSTFGSGSWLEVKGSNLATNTRTWAGGDFMGANAPIRLDGSSLSINNRAGFVYYISPTQMNVQAPADSATGPVQITVTNCAGTSAPVTIQKMASVPGMLAPASFNIGGKQFLVALFQDGVTYVGNPNLIPGVPFRPAAPSDSITSYGIGFGDVTPAIGPGAIAGQANSIPNLTISFGETPAATTYAGLAPNNVGLYQFNITVPDVPDGDYQIKITLNGVPLAQTLYLTVQR